MGKGERNRQSRRLRNGYDYESSILDHFRTGYVSRETLVSPQCDELEAVLHAVLDESGWIDRSGKGDSPPDFINPERKLMLEVMRADDHERLGDNGRSLVNPQKEAEAKLLKGYDEEFRQLLAQCPDARLFVNAHSDLPTEEDHNYNFYLDSFSRVIGKHGGHAESYRVNYPGYKLVFLVFDEATPLLSRENRAKRPCSPPNRIGYRG